MLNDLQIDLLATLATKVRLCSTSQIAAAWWGTETATPVAKRCLARLVRDGWLVVGDYLVEPLLPIAEPVLVWQLGDAAPDYAELERVIRGRWPLVVPEPVTAYSSSRTANQRFGGPRKARRVHRSQATHDLHLTQVYLLARKQRPRVAERWRGEDLVPKAGLYKKDPDAIVTLQDGREHVIEFAGKYDARHLRGFHEDCAARKRSFELW